MYPAIIDANIHRVCEGLRVVEEYFRFVASDATITEQLALLRKRISHHTLVISHIERLQARDASRDRRSNEPLASRHDIADLLRANMLRIQEGLRVLEEYTGDDTFRVWRYEMYDLEKVCFLSLVKPTFSLHGVYLISHDVDILREGIALGADIIQLRCKDEPKHIILQKAYEVRAMTREAAKPFIVNDYLDIAMLVDADGYHSGQDDISVAEIRKLWKSEKIYGRTTHNLEQGLQAREEGTTYVSVGPIYATPTKPDRPAIGFEYLSQAHTLGIPFVAIGGINTSTVAEVMQFAPPMIAVVRDYRSIPAFCALFHTPTIPSHT